MRAREENNTNVAYRHHEPDTAACSSCDGRDYELPLGDALRNAPSKQDHPPSPDMAISSYFYIPIPTCDPLPRPSSQRGIGLFTCYHEPPTRLPPLFRASPFHLPLDIPSPVTSPSLSIVRLRPARDGGNNPIAHPPPDYCLVEFGRRATYCRPPPSPLPPPPQQDTN